LVMAAPPEARLVAPLSRLLKYGGTVARRAPNAEGAPQPSADPTDGWSVRASAIGGDREGSAGRAKERAGLASRPPSSASASQSPPHAAAGARDSPPPPESDSA